MQGNIMIEQQFFEYARQCTALPGNIETHAERPAETIRISTQHLALIAHKTVSNGTGTIYGNDLYFIEKIIAEEIRFHPRSGKRSL